MLLQSYNLRGRFPNNSSDFFGMGGIILPGIKKGEGPRKARPDSLFRKHSPKRY
jgi:hypothetical protein